MLYFILDQADDGGADHFYVAGELDEDGVLVHYWTQDLLLACMFPRAEDAACTVDALDDLHLAVAALPESLVAFVVERHNYTETLDRVLLCTPCHRWVHSRKNTSRLFLS